MHALIDSLPEGAAIDLLADIDEILRDEFGRRPA